MDAINILMDEHRVIEQVLNCLEKLAHACERGEPLDIWSARQALDFFRTFADGFHHLKEEDFLFPLVECRWFRHGTGPIHVMLHEHELGRERLHALAWAVDAAESGNPAAVEVFVRHARDYVRLLRDHIQKENQGLFPAVAAALSSEDAGELLQLFGEFEKRRREDGTRARYLRLADELADRLGVPRTQAECLVEPLHIPAEAPTSVP
jgi:hemerythrin-like domain-containing protein